MKTGNSKTPSTVARARGISKWQTNSDGEPYKPERDESLGYRQCSDDGIADCVSRLCNPPPSTHAVVLKVRANIALRGLPLPEVIFISPERHPEALMDLAAKVQQLANQLANLGSFAVCTRDGKYCMTMSNEEE